MAAVDFVTGYITNYVDGMVRPYVEQGAAAVGDVAGGVMFSVSSLLARFSPPFPWPPNPLLTISYSRSAIKFQQSAEE